jgi:hypothetical protein
MDVAKSDPAALSGLNMKKTLRSNPQGFPGFWDLWGWSAPPILFQNDGGFSDK